MKKIGLMFILGIMVFASDSFPQEKIPLPVPVKESKVSLEEALNARKSVRAYLPRALTLEEVSNIAWAAYGKNKYRKTVPSAGALYPMFIYFVVGDVVNLEKGVYLYDYVNHALRKVSGEDVRFDLARAALSQSYVKEAPLVVVICARYQITTSKYGKRGIRYVHIEVGHVAQNIYLEAASLGLGTVDVGAFYDEEVKSILGIEEEPLLIMPIGKPSADTD